MNDAQFYEKVMNELKEHNRLEREKVRMLKVIDADLQCIDKVLREAPKGDKQDD